MNTGTAGKAVVPNCGFCETRVFARRENALASADSHSMATTNPLLAISHFSQGLTVQETSTQNHTSPQLAFVWCNMQDRVFVKIGKRPLHNVQPLDVAILGSLKRHVCMIEKLRLSTLVRTCTLHVLCTFCMIEKLRLSTLVRTCALHVLCNFCMIEKLRLSTLVRNCTLHVLCNFCMIEKLRLSTLVRNCTLHGLCNVCMIEKLRLSTLVRNCTLHVLCNFCMIEKLRLSTLVRNCTLHGLCNVCMIEKLRLSTLVRNCTLHVLCKNTCHLIGCTAKQQSPHENSETAFNLVLHCPYDQTTQPCKVRLLRVFRCPWLRSWRRR